MTHMPGSATARVVYLVGMLAGACATPRSAAVAQRLVGKPLVLALPALDGQIVDLGASDGRVRVVDFWASWCEPCKVSLPLLEALQRDLGPRGLVVYAVSVDEDRAQMLQFIDGAHLELPVLWDRGAEQLSRLGGTFLPVTLIADRHGIVRYVHQGWNDGQAAAQRREVEGLLDPGG